MSDGSEFQRRDAATGIVCQPTVVSRNDETSNDVMMTSKSATTRKVGNMNKIVQVWWH